MKILMVNKFLYPRGGSESYMLKLGVCLEKQGHKIEYFGMYDEKNTVGNSCNLYTSNMDFHQKGFSRFLYPFKIIYSFEAKRKIGKVLDNFKPDIVHMNNINFQLTPSIIYAIKKRKIPIVQTVHDYQMICPNHLLYDFKCQKPCEKCVGGSLINCIKNSCIHGSKIKSVIGFIEAKLYSFLKTYKKTDLYICPSNFLERKLKTANKIFDNKTFTIHNFIEKKNFSVKETEDYILYVGRLSPEKGIKLIAETAKVLKEHKFKVAGNGPDEDEIKHIPNIDVLGFVGGTELADLIGNAKLLIAPSVCYENCPLSILEAHSLGVPVVTMANGGMAELVEDGITGTLVRSPDAQTLSKAITKTLGSEDYYNNIKKNCLERSKNICDAEDYCKILVNKYKELIGRGEYSGNTLHQYNSSCL